MTVQAGQHRAGGILRAAATGEVTELLAAPPAGYLHVIPSLRVKNTDGALALDWAISDGEDNINVALGLAAGASISPLSTTLPPLYTARALLATIGGAGGDAIFAGAYQVVPENAVTTKLRCTDTFVALPLAVPPAGFVSIPAGMFAQIGFATGNGFVFNGDSSVANVQWQLTRGTVVMQDTITSATPVNGRQAGLVLPAILPGDEFAVRVAVAPTVPDSVIYYATFQRVPRALLPPLP